MNEPLIRPDSLVLAGGGVLGEAWMNGVLAGIEDAHGLDLREVDSLVGTSAGSILAAQLASGQRPRRPREVDAKAGEPMPAPGATFAAAAQPVGRLLGRALRYEQLPGALLRGTALRVVPRGTHSLTGLQHLLERSKAHFDGRLRVVGVERRSGRRVVFGAPGAPPASVARAVVASCSIPGWFEPIEINGHDYVDGGVWSITNLDVAPVGRASQVLCLHSMHRLALPRGSPLQLLRGRLSAELAILRRRGVRVQVVGPWSEAAAPMARNLMDGSHREQVHAAGYAQGLRL